MSLMKTFYNVTYRYFRAPWDIGPREELDDLVPRDRDLYLQNALPLTRPGTLFLLYTFEWELRWWERLMLRLAFFGALALAPGEVERRFGPHFEIERIAEELDYSKWPPGYAVCLMTRKQ